MSRHEITVDVDATGSFRVLDVGPARTLLVERLGGADDDPARAIACARDYAAQVAAFHAGARADLPLAAAARPPAGRAAARATSPARRARCRRPPDGAPWPPRARRAGAPPAATAGGRRGPARAGRDTAAAMARPPGTPARPT